MGIGKGDCCLKHWHGSAHAFPSGESGTAWNCHAVTEEVYRQRVFAEMPVKTHRCTAPLPTSLCSATLTKGEGIAPCGRQQYN